MVPRIFHMNGRVALGLCWLLSGSVVAQKAPELDLLIRFASAVTPIQEKYIHEVLRGIEPDMGVWVDVLNQQVKVRSHVLLHRGELQSAWGAIGLSITYFGPIIAQQQEDRATDDNVRIPGYNDGPADPPGYQEAKATWILAHPKEYEQLSDPLTPQ